MGTILGLKNHKLIAAILGLVVLGAALTDGIALATSHGAEPEPTPKTATVPTELSDHFAVLSESTTSGTGVTGVESADATTVTRLDESAEGPSGQFGLNPSLARNVAYGSEHVWVIPGSTGVCVHDFETGSGVCGPTSHALSGNITLDVGGDENGATGGGTIYGLAPNGNSVVVVHDANGSTEDVSVRHNVYVITHPGAVTVELVDGAGQKQTVSLPG